MFYARKSVHGQMAEIITPGIKNGLHNLVSDDVQYHHATNIWSIYILPWHSTVQPDTTLVHPLDLRNIYGVQRPEYAVQLLEFQQHLDLLKHCSSYQVRPWTD